jgi:hypothetical protein
VFTLADFFVSSSERVLTRFFLKFSPSTDKNSVLPFICLRGYARGENFQIEKAFLFIHLKVMWKETIR